MQLQSDHRQSCRAKRQKNYRPRFFDRLFHWTIVDSDELFSGRAECQATVVLPNQSNAATAEQSSASPSSNVSIDEQAAVDNVAVSLTTIKPNEADAVTETALSSDAERALEMIRITLATRSFDLKH
jgi:hypothetical protein